MALNFLNDNTDFVQRTAESRRITRTLVGDFTFDIFSDRHRNRVFLPRNMTKVLAYHDRNRTRGLETGTFRSPSSRTRGPFLGNSSLLSQAVITAEVIDGIKPQPKSQLNGSDASGDQEAGARPDIESMSQDCLKVKVQNESPGDSSQDKRRSIRNQLARQHEDKNAQLYFDIVNIRKKLNFKDTAAESDKRPRKRVRRENITCHCHVTIWDNRRGLEQKESLVRKSVLCDVLTSDMGSAGYSADIKLQQPFVFKSSELNIPLPTPRGSVLGIGDQYFLEIKIIPTKDDVDWPPVPILGRSEGDQTTGLGKMAAEKLQGALVARYLHLPIAPAPEVPLSVFFLHDGRTYRSKYGLEVSAAWGKGAVPEKMVKHEEDETQLNLWTVDEEGRSFGRKNSPKGKDSTPKMKEGKVGSSSKPRVKTTPKPPSPVKVVFNLDAASAKGAKEFRKSTLTGLCCPLCPKQVFGSIEDLQFHFMTSHSKYKFVVEKQDVDPTTNDLISVVFKVTAVGTARPRNSDREPRKSDRDINWQAPPQPLDVPAFVNGDQNWVEQNWAEGPPKKSESSATAVVLVPDKLSAIRQNQHGGYAPGQKGGFLPAEHVPQFRKSEHRRYPNIKLRTMTADKETMYTSVSHRQVRVGEEPRTESDDEMDDGWFVKKSLEALDIAAEKQDWTEEQRLLRHKWNLARLGEKLSHPRYLSDCLIRFVRHEKVWLKGGGNERKMAFAEFVDEFLQRRVINQDVVRDLWMILHDNDGTENNNRSTEAVDIHMADATPTVKKVSILPQQGEMSEREQRAEIMLRHLPYTCAVCVKRIEDLRRNGVHCSEHECEAPGVWYHNACVKCKRKDKLGWKCKLCVERLDEANKSKGKEVVIG